MPRAGQGRGERPQVRKPPSLSLQVPEQGPPCGPPLPPTPAASSNPHQPAQDHSRIDLSPTRTLPETAPLALARLAVDVTLAREEARMASMAHRVMNTQRSQTCMKGGALTGMGKLRLGSPWSSRPSPALWPPRKASQWRPEKLLRACGQQVWKRPRYGTWGYERTSMWELDFISQGGLLPSSWKHQR